MTTMLHTPAHAGLAIGHVDGLAEDGDVGVVMGDGRRMECARLYASDAGLTLSVGDEVLVLPRSAGAGVVVGRIGPGAAADDAPGELVIEARTSLTLRVGDGSITLREDGRILIRGSDLVSHATRRNRIRGGSVDIN